MKQCTECSTENSATTKFCVECGTKLPNEQPKVSNFSPSIGNDALVSGDISMIGKQETVHAQSYVVHNYQDSKAAPHGKCVLKIIADLSCKVYVDGEYHCDAEEGKVTRLPLRQGEYLLKFVSIENLEDVHSCEYTVDKPEEFLDVPLREKQEERETREGILINGVRWARYNVDEPGTFAAKPEDFGKFYQWNRRKAWNSTGVGLSDQDIASITGTIWEKTNDPSPPGWRVPTKEELEKLCDKTKVKSEWIVQNEVKGMKFTDIATENSIFLSATGFRNLGNMLYFVGENGFIWSSIQKSNTSNNAWNLKFSEYNTDVDNSSCCNGYPIRSVADN